MRNEETKVTHVYFMLSLISTFVQFVKGPTSQCLVQLNKIIGALKCLPVNSR